MFTSLFCCGYTITAPTIRACLTKENYVIGEGIVLGTVVDACSNDRADRSVTPASGALKRVDGLRVWTPPLGTCIIVNNYFITFAWDLNKYRIDRITWLPNKSCMQHTFRHVLTYPREKKFSTRLATKKDEGGLFCGAQSPRKISGFSVTDYELMIILIDYDCDVRGRS